MNDENLTINNQPNGETPDHDWDYNPNADGAIAIPVRIGVEPAPDAPTSPPMDEDDELVREYEARYFGTRRRSYQHTYEPVHRPRPRKRKRDWEDYWSSFHNVKLPPRHRYGTRAFTYEVDDNERLWAALAHGSALLTLLALFTTGPGVVFALLIPLGIYLVFRRRSEFVAYHALQAFTAQTVGTIGAFTLLLVGSVVLVLLIVISAIFSVILIGIPFLIAFSLLLLLLVVITLLTPLALLLYSVIAANAAWKGRNYRYPYVADWVDDQLTNGFLRTTTV